MTEYKRWRLIMNRDKTYFIADIAGNHDGDLDRAKHLCLLAKESGADAAKFQHFKTHTIISDSGFKQLGKKSHQSSWNKSVYEMAERVCFPFDWTQELKQYCDEIGIDFFTSPYDLDYVDEIDSYVSIYKIGSGDITYHKIIHKIASKGKPVLVATGASDMSEVESAVHILDSYGVPIVLMQCNTNYTASPENFKHINLNVLHSYKQLEQKIANSTISLGLSDHTYGDVTVLGAVALGARYIEKHFTDDNDRDGPDHPFSMTPETWKTMVERTRLLEAALGDGVKVVEKNEQETVVIQRRALRVKSDLSADHVLTEDDIVELRPCPKDALTPVFNVVGHTLIRDVNEMDYLRREDVQHGE